MSRTKMQKLYNTYRKRKALCKKDEEKEGTPEEASFGSYLLGWKLNHPPWLTKT